MSQEIEVKLAIADLSVPRARLIERGATRIGKFLETNVFFDTEDRSLLASDEGLRLRSNKNMETGESEFIVTYKGPRHPGVFKSREELEVNVSNQQIMVALLERLGFKTTISFEKKRERFLLGTCHVELDELPRLGTYLEIEGPNEDEIRSAQESLGLSDRPMVKTGYAALVTSYLQERGEPQRTLKF